MKPAARVTAMLGTVVIVIGGALLPAAPASAATWGVNVPGDGAGVPGTLRWALSQAESLPGPDTIDITYTGTIPAGGTALPTITEDLRITGPGAANLTVGGFGTVFNITGGTVSISGLTLTSTDPSASGIISSGADLTLSDIVADGFGGNGIYAEDGSLALTDVEANRNGSYGVQHLGMAAARDLSLTRVTADNNGTEGVHGVLVGSTLTASDLQTNANTSLGAVFILDAGSGTITGFTGNDNGLFGLIGVARNTRLTITGSTTDRNFAGTAVQANDGATVTISASSASDNKTAGFSVESTGSTVSLLSSDSISNGDDPCGCGGPGVSLDADASEITLSDVDLTDNEASYGAGLDVFALSGGSSLMVTNARILRNIATEGTGGLGGGISVRGFADPDTTMTVVDSTIDSNTAKFGGAGIYLEDLGLGAPTGSVTILRTTISNNIGGDASEGGGIDIDRFSNTVDGSPIITIDSSTLSGNSADDGGGLSAFKYDTSDSPGIIDIVNSTISGNRAPENGAGYFGSYADTGNAIVRVRHSTILNNSAEVGPGGLFVDRGIDFLLDHSVLAFNTPGDLQVDPLNATTAAWNIVRDPEVATAALLIPADHNRVGIDPKLGPLADNGGPTLTHLPLTGSPALNTGDPAFVASPALDQRGLPRVSRVIDIGAVEVAEILPATGTPSDLGGPLLALVLLLGGTTLLAWRVRAGTSRPRS